MDEQLIEIKQDIPGFDGFFGSWLCRDGLNLLIDVGPANSADHLIQSLSRFRVDRLDYVLITHIHLDHVGALARVLARYPMARAVCHKDAVQHIVDPGRLWEGSLAVLGDLARAYGAPRPVSREILVPHTETDIRGLQVIETPGHAHHHISFCYAGRLYAGEASGDYLTIDGHEYVRPATPPRFFLNVSRQSIATLLELEDQPMRYAHFGKAASSHVMLKRFRDQLTNWEAVVRDAVHKGGTMDHMVQRSMDRLLTHDPNLAAFNIMHPALQQRELRFLANDVRGFIGFVTAQD